MKSALPFVTVIVATGSSYVQDKISNKSKTDLLGKDLRKVVVTSQYQPPSLRNSVYQTCISTAERIRLRAAVIQSISATDEGGITFVVTRQVIGSNWRATIGTIGDTTDCFHQLPCQRQRGSW